MAGVSCMLLLKIEDKRTLVLPKIIKKGALANLQQKAIHILQLRILCATCIYLVKHDTFISIDLRTGKRFRAEKVNCQKTSSCYSFLSLHIFPARAAKSLKTSMAFVGLFGANNVHSNCSK